MCLQLCTATVENTDARGYLMRHLQQALRLPVSFIAAHFTSSAAFGSPDGVWLSLACYRVVEGSWVRAVWLAGKTTCIHCYIREAGELHILKKSGRILPEFLFSSDGGFGHCRVV